jgi:hypothetical protein
MPLIKIMMTFIVLLASNDCCGDLIFCNFIDVYCDIHNSGTKDVDWFQECICIIVKLFVFKYKLKLKINVVQTPFYV